MYKGRPPEGGRGVEIVDENGHGGRGGSVGEWMSNFPDFLKYNCEQNLKHQKKPENEWTSFVHGPLARST